MAAKKVGVLIREARLNAGMTQEQLARKVKNCSASDISAAERGVKDAPGPIVNEQGTVLGTHSGLSDYTIGQRKGIGIAAPEPYYVVGKRVERNELVVGFASEARTSAVRIGDLVWQSISSLSQALAARVKLRYRSTAATCIMEPAVQGGARVVLREPQTLTAPGQYAVLYDSDIVLGSGKILEVERV